MQHHLCHNSLLLFFMLRFAHVPSQIHQTLLNVMPLFQPDERNLFTSRCLFVRFDHNVHL